MRKFVLLAFFFSGFAGLVLENLWVHNLVLVFGGTTAAIVTVLTAFMGGLALGSYMGGRWSKHIKTPVRAYGLFEGGVALYALLFPTLLKWLPQVSLLGAEDGTFFTKTFVRFVFCGLLLLLPTTLMGATLPILSRFAAHHGKGLGFDVGLLYSVNTFGAVVGAMTGGFLLLPWLGHQKTLYLVTSCLLLMATALVLWGSRFTFSVEDEPPPPTKESGTPGVAQVPEARPALHRAIVTGIALTGGLAMACQVLWSRSLSMIIGSSTYAFTLILSTFLIGLASGAAWGAWWTQRTARLLRLWVLFLLATGYLVMCGSGLLDRLPDTFAWTIESLGLLDSTSAAKFQANPFVLFGIKAWISAIPILLPTLCMGAFFPLVLGLYRRQQGDIGRRVGNLYAANTLGSILGSTIAGFVMIPWLGLRLGLLGCVALYLLCGGMLSFFLSPDERRFPLLIAICGLALLPFLPSWNMARMNSGLFRLTAMKLQRLTKKPTRLRTIFYKEGLNTTVAVQLNPLNLPVLKVNGKIDASAIADAPTQLALSVFPILLHQNPKDLLIIGWGSGMTAGAALQFPIKSVTAVELEPAIITASKFFRRWNYQPLRDPRLKLLLDDGRNVLTTTNKSFDIIISEPSNPWISGVSNLFTVEFFRQVFTRLKKDGVFCQWIQMYEISPENFYSILRSLRKVFPHIALFETGLDGGDAIVIASKKPPHKDLKAIQKIFKKPSLSPLFSRLHISTAADLARLFILSEKQLDVLLKKSPGPLNTDDHNLLAYFAPFDLFYLKKNNPVKEFERHLKKELRNFQQFFNNGGKPLHYNSLPSFWYTIIMSFFRTGHLKQAAIHIKHLQAMTTPYTFVPKLHELSRMIEEKEPPPPLLTHPTPHKLEINDRNAKLFHEIKQGFAKKIIKTCTQHILPLTTQPGFQTHLPGVLWFYIGACFAHVKKYPDALFSFYQYQAQRDRNNQPASRPSVR